MWQSVSRRLRNPMRVAGARPFAVNARARIFMPAGGRNEVPWQSLVVVAVVGGVRAGYHALARGGVRACTIRRATRSTTRRKPPRSVSPRPNPHLGSVVPCGSGYG